MNQPQTPEEIVAMHQTEEEWAATEASNLQTAITENQMADPTRAALLVIAAIAANLGETRIADMAMEAIADLPSSYEEDADPE